MLLSVEAIERFWKFMFRPADAKAFMMVWRGMVSTLRADRSRRCDLKELLALRNGEDGTDAVSVGEVGECMSTAVAGGVSSSLCIWGG